MSIYRIITFCFICIATSFARMANADEIMLPNPTMVVGVGTQTPTVTATVTGTVSTTPTASAIPTQTPVASVTATGTVTANPTEVARLTATARATLTGTAVTTGIPSSTATAQTTATIATPTSTPNLTRTANPTATSAIPTPTNTPIPRPTNTIAFATPTSIVIIPTSTPDLSNGGGGGSCSSMMVPSNVFKKLLDGAPFTSLSSMTQPGHFANIRPVTITQKTFTVEVNVQRLLISDLFFRYDTNYSCSVATGEDLQRCTQATTLSSSIIKEPLQPGEGITRRIDSSVVGQVTSIRLIRQHPDVYTYNISGYINGTVNSTDFLWLSFKLCGSVIHAAAVAEFNGVTPTPTITGSSTPKITATNTPIITGTRPVTPTATISATPTLTSTPVAKNTFVPFDVNGCAELESSINKISPNTLSKIHSCLESEDSFTALVQFKPQSVSFSSEGCDPRLFQKGCKTPEYQGEIPKQIFINALNLPAGPDPKTGALRPTFANIGLIRSLPVPTTPSSSNNFAVRFNSYIDPSIRAQQTPLTETEEIECYQRRLDNNGCSLFARSKFEDYLLMCFGNNCLGNQVEVPWMTDGFIPMPAELECEPKFTSTESEDDQLIADFWPSPLVAP